MVIRTRRKLLDGVRALRDTGTTPAGVDKPELYRMRAGGALLPLGANGLELTADVIHARAEAIAAS